MKVLVTGANGFLGPYICTAIRQAGYQVRAAVRDLARPAAADEQVVLHTQGEKANWAEAVKDVDAVVHLAARAHRPPARQQAERHLYELVNVTNTVELARLAAAARVRHFILQSSLAVNGPATDGRAPFREDDVPLPATVYAHSKLEAEKGVERIAAQSDMRLAIVRPPFIYGRGARGNFSLLTSLLRRGIPLPVAAIDNRRAFAAAENVAGFIVHTLRKELNGTYIVADDEPVSTTEFVRTLAAGMNIRPRLFKAPPRLCTQTLAALGMQHIANSLFGSLEADCSKAHQTGWTPGFSLQEALRRYGTAGA